MRIAISKLSMCVTYNLEPVLLISYNQRSLDLPSFLRSRPHCRALKGFHLENALATGICYFASNLMARGLTVPISLALLCMVFNMVLVSAVPTPQSTSVARYGSHGNPGRSEAPGSGAVVYGESATSRTIYTVVSMVCLSFLTGMLGKRTKKCLSIF
jgi:hypothetical protein